MEWRLLRHGAAPGAWNMAVDEALLLCAEECREPTLRFYSWQPACLSLGRFQKSSRLSTACAGAGYDLVRRPTGGRAVLHHHEITYAMVLREELLPRDWRSVTGSYRWLSHGLVEGLKILGVDAQMSREAQDASTVKNARHSGPSRPQPVRRQPAEGNCFSATAGGDCTVGGSKLLGSAQCRTGGALLQHGSLLVRSNQPAWEIVFGTHVPQSTSLAELGVPTAPNRVTAALMEGMSHALDCSFRETCLTTAEELMAQRLHSVKYTMAGWTLNGIARSHAAAA